MIQRQHNEGVPGAELTETTSCPPTEYQACKRSHNQQTTPYKKENTNKGLQKIVITFKAITYTLNGCSINK